MYTFCAACKVRALLSVILLVDRLMQYYKILNMQYDKMLNDNIFKDKIIYL